MKKAFKSIKEFFCCLLDGFRYLPILWGSTFEKEEDDDTV